MMTWQLRLAQRGQVKSNFANVKTFPSVHTVVCVSILLVFSGFALFRCSEARSVVLFFRRRAPGEY